MPEPEYWLRGPIDGIAPLLQPVAHALFQAREDVAAARSRSPVERLWMAPHGAGSIGFHVKHLCGSLDRLIELLAHASGHTTRHAGQIITTAKIVAA